MPLTPPVEASPEASQSQDDAPPPSRWTRCMLTSTEALDCSVCFLPLKPPFFQCPVGHCVCSLCRDGLARMGRCHLCRAPTVFEHRCHVMETMAESFCVRCPHAAHGCAYLPPYHDGERHARECAHAPLLRCPGGCRFAGPAAALAAHAAAAHGWPCTAKAAAGLPFGVDLRGGFNFLTADRGYEQHLILLSVATTAFGRAIAAVSLARKDTTTTSCELELSYSCHTQNQLPGHHFSQQKARFQVARTDLSNGLPDPYAPFQFFVPKYGDGSDEVTFKVSAQIFITQAADTDTKAWFFFKKKKTPRLG